MILYVHIDKWLWFVWDHECEITFSKFELDLYFIYLVTVSKAQKLKLDM